MSEASITASTFNFHEHISTYAPLLVLRTVPLQGNKRKTIVTGEPQKKKRRRTTTASFCDNTKQEDLQQPDNTHIAVLTPGHKYARPGLLQAHRLLSQAAAAWLYLEENLHSPSDKVMVEVWHVDPAWLTLLWYAVVLEHKSHSNGRESLS